MTTQSGEPRNSPITTTKRGEVKARMRIPPEKRSFFVTKTLNISITSIRHVAEAENTGLNVACDLEKAINGIVDNVLYL